MNVLLIYPQCPDSFWNFKYALKFISKKAAVPPLGLITVSAMLPNLWQKRLTDMNIEPLRSSDIEWSDYVFISAMYIQKDSVAQIIHRCKKYNTRIVAGGPLFTQEYTEYPEIDHFILNEAEITLPEFLNDLEANNTPKHVYRTDQFADITTTPVPDYHLLSRTKYASMNLQISRGCPYSCDFCEITSLLGHKVRIKEPHQVLKELDLLYKLNWRGGVSVVDDNFIGNRKHAKNNLLPAMIDWMRQHNYPFRFSAQTSINLADDKELLSLMIDAGFRSTFIGIETPDEATLKACNKSQNKNRNLLKSVSTIQKGGLHVSGGFIVGFDSDTQSVFQRQIDFIQKSGIVSAMVGLLNAPKNTKLYTQMEHEKRLTIEASGNNTDYSMNFIPKMNAAELQAGYRSIIQNIYCSKQYYRRLRQLLLNYKKPSSTGATFSFSLLLSLIKSVFIIGFVSKGRFEYWKLIIWTIYHRPGSIIDAITYTVYGYHFRMVYGLT